MSKRRRFNRVPGAAYIAVCVAMAIGVAFLAVQGAVAPEAPQSWTRFAFLDYRDTVWLPINDQLAGNVPWDTDAYLRRHPGAQMYPVYVPSYWWFGLLMAVLPYKVSVAIWAAVLVASLAGMVWVSARLFWPRATLGAGGWLALVLVLTLASRPLRTSLSQGQWALVCGAGAVIALSRLSASRGAVVGAVLAIVKPPVGLPLLVALCLSRRSRTAAAACLVSLALAIPVLVWTWVLAGSWGELVRVLLSVMSLGAGDVVGSQSLTNVGGLFTNLGFRGPSWVSAAAAVFVALLLGSAIVVESRRGAVVEARGYTACILLLLMVTPNYLYAAVVLIPAVLAMVKLVLTSLKRRDVGGVVLGGAITVLLLVPQLVPGRVVEALGGSSGALNVVNEWCLLSASLLLSGWVLVGWWWGPDHSVPMAVNRRAMGDGGDSAPIS